MLSKLLLFCAYCFILIILNHRSQSSICGGSRDSTTTLCISGGTFFSGPMQNNIPESTCYPWDCEYFFFMFSNPLNVKIFTYNLRPHAEEVNVLPAFYVSKSLNMKKRGCVLIWYWKMPWTMGVSEFLTPIKALSMCIQIETVCHRLREAQGGLRSHSVCFL